MRIRVLIRMTIMLFLFLTIGTVSFAEESNPLLVELKDNGSETSVPLLSYEVDGKPYFFLPSGVTDGNIKKSFTDDTSYEVMNSANIASVHFFSENPAEKGRNYVHQNKDNKAPGEVFMYDENFCLLYHGNVDALKGRGNTTWKFTDKKSYQLKLEKKADLLDPQGGSQKEKKWLLLANPYDPTLIKNSMILNFGREIGLENTPEGRPVDLYYDGEYRGSYYLCEKVEIGDGRVEIEGLEKDVEAANKGVDMEALAEVKGKNAFGNEIKYEEGITDPQDIRGGYLLEIDYAYHEDEKSWFNFGYSYIVSKSPEYLSKNMMEYISQVFTKANNYIQGEYNKSGEGTDLYKYIDLESFAKLFLVNEWFANQDAWTSSTFMYKPRNEEILYAGPLWDFDSTMQIRVRERNPEKWFSQWMGLHLFALPEFRKVLQEVYQTDVRPVIFNNLLGETAGTYLKPVNQMKNDLAESLAMNYKIWQIDDCLGLFFPEETVEKNYGEMLSWMQQRAKWFDKQIMSDDFIHSKTGPCADGHLWDAGIITKRATCTEAGSKTLTCRRCCIKKKTAICSPKTFKLSTTVYEYNGKAKKPAVTVKDSNNKTIAASNYVITCSNNIRVGEATAQIAFKGSEYTGTKTLSFKIVPKKPVVSSITVGKKKMTVRMKTKVSKTAGKVYQIAYRERGSSKWKYTTTTKQNKVIKSLKKKKNYQVKVRAYKTFNKIKYYGAWSKIKTTKMIK